MADETNNNIFEFADLGERDNPVGAQLNPEQLHERLRSIIRTVSGDHTLEITTQLSPEDAAALEARGMKPEDAWFYTEDRDPSTGKLRSRRVHIPDTIVESSLDVARGKAAHEAAHSAISRTSFIPEEVAQELGFQATLMAVEERATDQTVRARYRGAGRWVDTARLDNLATYDAASDQIRSMPRFLQLNDLIVHGRQMSDEQIGYLEPEVVEVYQTILQDIQEIEETIPSPESSEPQIIETAALRYAKVYKKVWSQVKTLVDKDNQDLAESMSQDIDQSQEQLGDEASDTLAEIEDVKQQLQKMSEQKQQAGESAEGQQASDDGPSQANQAIGSQQQQTGDTSNGQTQPSQEQAGTNASAGQGETNDQSQANQAQSDTEPSQGQGEDSQDSGQTQETSAEPTEQELKDRLEKLIEKLFSELPEEVQAKLMEQAKESLEKLEDEFTKQLKSDLSADNLPSHQEAEEAQNQDGEATEDGGESGADSNQDEQATGQPSKDKKPSKVKPKERGGGLDQKMAEIEKAVEALRSGDIYDQCYKEVSPIIEDLWQKLEPVFFPRKKGKPILKSSGNKVNLAAVFKMEASIGGGSENPDTRIFEVLNNPDINDYALTLLVDLSGSMQGEKIEETFRAAIIISEVLNRLGIKFEILGFQDELISFKEFSDDLDGSIRKKLSGMLLEVYDNNPGGHNYCNRNDDGPCLDQASERLSKEPEKEKIIIVLSDGMPNGRYSGVAELREAITKILANTEHKLIAVGLGPETTGLRDFYPVTATDISAENLSEVLSTIIEDVLVNPQKYSPNKTQ